MNETERRNAVWRTFEEQTTPLDKRYKAQRALIECKVDDPAFLPERVGPVLDALGLDLDRMEKSEDTSEAAKLAGVHSILGKMIAG